MKSDKYEITMKTGRVYILHAVGEKSAIILAQAQAINNGERYEIYNVVKL